MPAMHGDTQVADVWFERGMVYFQNPRNPEEAESCTLERFKDFIEILQSHIDDEGMRRKFTCGTEAMQRFIYDAMDLIKEIEPQLHVGLPIDVISEIERSRAGISRRQGFESPSSIAGVYRQLSSGLVVPE